MHTFATLEAGHQPLPHSQAFRKGPAAVLHLLCASLALYPLLERFIVPVLAAAFLLSATSVVGRLFANGLRTPPSFIWGAWGMFFAIYVFWFCVALIRQNPIAYINQDSFGFLLYIFAMPVLYLYIRWNRLEQQFFRFIEICSWAIGLVSIALVAGFFLMFGEINSDSMVFTNLFLRSLGLSWTIDHNHGMLGLYSNIAHLVLLGNALALHRYALHHRRKDLLLVLVCIAALALDGRRALVISAVLQLLIIAPRLMSALKPAHRILLLASAAVLTSAFVVTNLEWVEQRFEFSEEDVSTALRQEQIPPLLEKIAENPVLGGGFGTVARLLRSQLRPFSYEVDFLATFMKLGMVGGLLYFGTYLFVVSRESLRCGARGIFYISAGWAFFFFMGTNGNQAMSTDSAIFHIFLFLLIAFSQVKPARQPQARTTEPQAAA